MSTEDILKRLREYQKSDEGFAHELQLSLADIVFERLGDLEWTQAQLAHAAGMKESFVSRILHAEESNCTFKTAGRLLRAMGVRARLRIQEKEAVSVSSISTITIGAVEALEFDKEETYGQTIPFPQAHLTTAEIGHWEAAVG